MIKYLQIAEMMCGWLKLCLFLLSLIADVLCRTLVLIIDSRCPTSLVIIGSYIEQGITLIVLWSHCCVSSTGYLGLICSM